MKKGLKWISAMLALALMLTLAAPLSSLAATRGNEGLAELNLDLLHTDPTGTGNRFLSHFKLRWIQVTRHIGDTPQSVQLKVIQDDNETPDSHDKTVYNKTFENVTGTFKSPEIFLDFVRSDTVPYRLELYRDGQLDTSTYIYRMLLDLKGNEANSRGIRFRDYDSSLTSKWWMFTPLNFSDIPNGGNIEVDVIGSNMYIIGKLYLFRDGDYVLLRFVNIDEYWKNTPGDRPDDYNAQEPDDHKINVRSIRFDFYPYLSAMESVDPKVLPSKYQLDTWYSITDEFGGRDKQILYFHATVDYDPNGLIRITDTYSSDRVQALVRKMEAQ